MQFQVIFCGGGGRGLGRGDVVKLRGRRLSDISLSLLGCPLFGK